MIVLLLAAFWFLVLFSIWAAGRIGREHEVKPLSERPAWSSPGRTPERARFWPKPCLTRLTQGGRREIKPVRFRFNLLAPGQGVIGFNAREGRPWWVSAPFFEFPWEQEERVAERTREQIAEAEAEFDAADQDTKAALLEAAQSTKEKMTWKPLVEREQREQFFTLDPVKDFEAGLVPVAAAIGIPVHKAAAWRREWTRLGAPRFKGVKGELGSFGKEQRVLKVDLAGHEAGKFEEIRDKLADWRA